jgi:asparagine N-glycosylation enzyme membrane subunit Stt3
VIIDDATYKVYGYDEAIKRFMSMGNNTFRYNMRIWTSSEKDKSTVAYLTINSSSTSFVNYHNKDVTDLADVRPFIAF